MTRRQLGTLTLAAVLAGACANGPDDSAPPFDETTPVVERTIGDVTHSEPVTVPTEAAAHGDDSNVSTTVDSDISDTFNVADTTSTGARCWSAEPFGGSPIRMADRTESAGLIDPLTGMHGHAVAAGDVDGDGWTDLFVAGFADRPTADYQERGATGPSPDRLLLGGPDGFRVDPTFQGELARTSGATFSDLTGDGRLELIAVRNPRGEAGIGARPTTIYRQSGDGWEPSTILLEGVGGRAVATLDVERNGLPDLIVTADRWVGGSTTLLRNLGGLRFEDATAEWGVPGDMLGLAVATVDLDGDGWVDVIVSGEPRVLMGGPDGFRVEQHPELEWEEFGSEDDAAGIAVGDLTGDGRPDLVVGHHFNSTLDLGARIPVRVFLNRADGDGFRLEEVTEQAGSPPLWTKSPHVAIVDLDNDGHNDIVTSAMSADGVPIVLRNLGLDGGVAIFETLGEPGDGSYLVTGVEIDANRDGRIDVFQVEWFPDHHSPLFVNEGGGGTWVQLDLGDTPAAPGGSRIELRSPDDDSILGAAWVATSTGYAAGPAPIVHIGLGELDTTHVRAIIEPVGRTAFSVNVATNARTALIGC